MKKKIGIVLLSTALAGAILTGTLSVLAETSVTEQSENFIKKANMGEIKLGKITNISGNTISAELAQKPEKPELNFTGEVITADVSEDVKIRKDFGEEAEISSLSEGDIVRFIYDSDGKLIEISLGMPGRHRGEFFENKNCKLGKITDISGNTISAELAQKPEKPEEPTENKEPAEEPELTFTGEIITADVSEDVKIRKDFGEEADISSLSEGDIVRFIYDNDGKLIEISLGMPGRHRGEIFENKNCKLGKITDISGNTISAELAEFPEKPEEPTENKEPAEKPELNFTGEIITADISEDVKIRKDFGEEAEISSLSEGDIVRFIYDNDGKLIEISSGFFKERHKERKKFANIQDFGAN